MPTAASAARLLCGVAAQPCSPFTAGGLINLRSQTYGRYEFRAKVPKGKGIDSYATLWPDGDDDDHATLIEILAPGPDSAHLTNGYGSGKGGRTVTGAFSDAFHTYTIEWSPTRGSVSELWDRAHIS